MEDTFASSGKKLSLADALKGASGLALDGKGKSLAILTSGGDSQGMNATLRAVVRMALSHNMRAFVVREGYVGLVQGGDQIEECQWSTVSNIIHMGGTIIGTARCKEFMERPGRIQAAENLIKAGINNLVIIGGDGSLTGANIFKEEWKGYTEELVSTKRVTEAEVAKCPYINIVGLVGSIDNDMCGTDMTIGADSALHRIIEAIDCIVSTASSHQRSFVLEVMGRHCGYLALMAGIAGAADWVLLPEQPMHKGWEDDMCERVKQLRQLGKRLTIVIVSEGAIDTENKKITSQYVKSVLEERLHHDTRITILGHVQRGGKPSAFDRAMGCRVGAAAALSLLQAQGEVPPTMIGIQGNLIKESPLMSCVMQTKKIDKAMEIHDYNAAVGLRGDSFRKNISLIKRLELSGKAGIVPEGKKLKFGVMNVGSPAAGMNGAVRAFVRLMLFHGHTVLGISNGFEGLLSEDECGVRPMTWKDVTEWSSQGGSNLGTNRTKPTPQTMPEIAAKFGEYGIDGLLIIGGFEGYESLIELQKAREHYVAFRIPLLGIAATTSNNVPGTEYSLGCDTALNMIVTACDILRQSAHASRKRVFVVETMGRYCGYLPTLAALAAGADVAYIFEEQFTISDLQKDVACLIGKFQDGLQRGLILKSEYCSENFTIDFMEHLLAEEGKGMFLTRSNKLGHLQEGEAPSAFDRVLAVKYATIAVDFLIEQARNSVGPSGRVSVVSDESAAMVGIQGVKVETTPLSKLIGVTDFEHMVPKKEWWMSLRPMLSVLSHHSDHAFVGEQIIRDLMNGNGTKSHSLTSEHKIVASPSGTPPVERD